MSDRQDRSPSCSVIPVPFVLGMQHDTQPTDSHALVSSNTTTPSHWLSTAFQSAPTYTPSLSSNFVVDEFSQPHAAQVVDMLETGMRITYPSPTGPPPHPPTPFLPPYPNNTVLSPTCHHSPVSPSPLSHLHQPALAISNSPPDTGIPRRAVAGSLDPSTGIFYRTPEPPRLRTAQACEKCRVRKAKCSGEHPACQRCLLRGLACIYASEGRTRGPTKLKVKPLTMVSPPESRSTRRNKNRSSSNGTSTPGFHLSTDLVTSGSQPATFAPPNSSCLSSTPLLYDDCFTQDNGDLEFLSSLEASPTLHRRGASTQATDTTTGSAMDINGVLGEYLDWTSLKDIKEHWEGDLSDMETLFNVT
ncbi:hypothetical protein F5J12DRAFT_795834 [Pisolithus orientalis]|uniref:uncharacterized protein n=1 Tax=Pisolithus orientalis TaxID=936130 RepID=UPI00222497D9|nr:uncharacterized protein F5J12DRAFT_795834 [Pisolithus orientalis]KAI6032672.1 hypothetical protein F5J12DRAFT_795834 [Pisolithus orientalis]